MKPNLLMHVWMMVHVYGAEYQAVVCYAGSSGEVAFRESLCPQYTSDRHDAKGLRTYHITGTCGDTSISRIACGQIGRDVAGANDGQLHITITSNTHSWQEGDLTANQQLVSLGLDMQSTVSIAPNFLFWCVNLRRVNLESLRSVEVLPKFFLWECSGLEEVDLSPLVNVREVEDYFMSGCTSMKSIDLTPLRAVEVLPSHFLYGCNSLEEVDLSPLVNLREVGDFCLSGCTSMKSIDLTPLRAVDVLSRGFLCECHSLEEVDLSPLIQLTNVSEECLQNCRNLKTIRLAPHQLACLLPSNIRELVTREENRAQRSSSCSPIISLVSAPSPTVR